MRGAILYGPHDIRVEHRDDPTIVEPTDAIIRLSATCVCGSDLWPYLGTDDYGPAAPMGHEYVGIVEAVGADVNSIRPGQFVVGSFFASDNTCEICRAGYQSSCVHRELMGQIGTQAEYARIPLADGTLVATPEVPSSDLIPSFLAASDVLGTGWFGAVAAEVGPGKTVAVVGDGAVGLLGVHSVIEAVGTRESMLQAIGSVRPGGHVGYVGVTHGDLPGDRLFFSHAHLHGGPAPVRRFLPELIDLISTGAIHPGKVFDLTLPLDQAADGYRAMDERRAIKTLLTV
jgi:threonine dehydrogenase-like Zn-dependent dehydrogenase